MDEKNEKQAEREALTTAADAAAFIERKADDYANRFGYGVAGTLSFGSQVKMDHYTSLTELAEEIRALAAPAPSASPEPVAGESRLVTLSRECTALLDALVYVAHMMHAEPQHRCCVGLTLIDHNGVEVKLPDGRVVAGYASPNSDRKISPSASRAALTDKVLARVCAAYRQEFACVLNHEAAMKAARAELLAASPADQVRYTWDQMRDYAFRYHKVRADAMAPAAHTLREYHEDRGPVVWFAWDAQRNEWMGEPAWIGKPDDDDWPGYHTHWIPHPAFPRATPPAAEGEQA